MMKFTHLFFIICLMMVCGSVSAQKIKADSIIRMQMDMQTKAWNRGDLDAFMDSYWKDDRLTFIGKSGITYSWQKTLDNYKKGYPDKEAMGILTFHILSIEKISKDVYFVIGKWHLKRKNDEPQGHYTLIWKKIEGKWVIVSDHSS